MGRAQGKAGTVGAARRSTAGFVLDDQTAAALRELRDDIRLEEGGDTDPAVAGGKCGLVSECVPGVPGLEAAEPMLAGAYLAQDGRLIYDHCWNVLPDGTILDATADQFNEGEDIRVLGPGDPAAERYRDWSELDVVTREMAARVDDLVAENGAAGRRQAAQELGDVGGYVYMEGGADEFAALVAVIQTRHPGLEPARPSWMS